MVNRVKLGNEGEASGTGSEHSLVRNEKTPSFTLIYHHSAYSPQFPETINYCLALPAEEARCEHSKSHYSPKLKRITVLAYTSSVTTRHIQEKHAFARFPPLSLPQNSRQVTPAIASLRKLSTSYEVDNVRQPDIANN